MKVGDLVEVSLNTGQAIYKNIYKLPGRIRTVSNDHPMVSLTGVPEVYVTVEHPQEGRPYEFGAPLSWFEDAGPNRWTLNMPDRGQFSLPDEEEKT